MVRADRTRAPIALDVRRVTAVARRGSGAAFACSAPVPSHGFAEIG
jgi:hypothetical protein